MDIIDLVLYHTCDSVVTSKNCNNRPTELLLCLCEDEEKSVVKLTRK